MPVDSHSDPEPGSRESRGSIDQREHVLLKTARAILRDGGYDSLSMKVLAERAGISRVTLYKHFANRQEIILKLAIQSTERRAEMAEMAALFKASTRERLMGVVSVLRVLLPYHLRHEILILDAGVRERASAGLLHRLETNEDRILAVVIGVIRDGVVAGDVALPANLPPERLGLAIMHLENGSHVLMQREFTHGRHRSTDSLQLLRDFWQAMLDQFAWRPLSTEFEYFQSVKRMWREIFPDLLRRFNIDHRQISQANWDLLRDRRTKSGL